MVLPKTRLVWFVLAATALASVVALGGCSSSSSSTTTKTAAPTTAAAPTTTSTLPPASTTSTVPVARVPALGLSYLPDGVPIGGALLGGQVVGFGNLQAGAGKRPALWFPVAGGGWGAESIGTDYRWVLAMAQLGETQVALGNETRSAGSPDPVRSFAAALQQSGKWVFSDLGGLFEGQSVEAVALGLTGSPDDPAAMLVAVGATSEKPPNTFLTFDTTGARPFAALSADGTKWQLAGELPLPDGVTNAIAGAVTYAPEGTPFPGVIVVGRGLAPDDTLGTRSVGIVWHSADAGKTWEVISDDSFDEPGRNKMAIRVAADATNILIGGRADVPGTDNAGSGTPRQETLLWTPAADGSWTMTGDAPSLGEGRASYLTALAPLKAGGFVAVSEAYDATAGATGADQDIVGDPAVQVLAGPDPGSLVNVTEAVPDIDQGAIVTDVVELGRALVFFGMDTSGKGVAWTVDSSSLK